MQWFLEQGVSLETHTLTHPCPLLHGYNLERASSAYHGCVDLLAKIPNSQPVGFRFPCMDGQNTPSPRAYAEILNNVSAEGRFLSMSTSVGCVFTPDDPEVSKTIFAEDAGGAQRFARYLMNGCVSYIENYPYPYVIGKLCWQFPCAVPSDWQAQKLHGVNNPVTVNDLKAALDIYAKKKGVLSLIFHPHGWIRNTQLVELIDHAVDGYAGKVRFLNFDEAAEKIRVNLLSGQTLRGKDGRGGEICN